MDFRRFVKELYGKKELRDERPDRAVVAEARGAGSSGCCLPRRVVGPKRLRASLVYASRSGHAPTRAIAEGGLRDVYDRMGDDTPAAARPGRHAPGIQKRNQWRTIRRPREATGGVGQGDCAAPCGARRPAACAHQLQDARLEALRRRRMAERCVHYSSKAARTRGP